MSSTYIISAVLAVCGLIVYFYYRDTNSFFGRIVLVGSIGLALILMLAEGRENRLKEMENKIKELEEAQKKTKHRNKKEIDKHFF